MIQTEKTRMLAQQTLYLISAHTALFVLYYYAHGKLDMLFDLTTQTPILLIFCFAPLAAVLFLSTSSARQGAVVLLGVLPAELIYNIVTRFTASTSFSALVPSAFWNIMYEGSFGLVLVIEVVASWMTFKVLQEIHKQLNTPPENPLS